MSEQLQLRRGTAAQVQSFTGAQGEAVVDTSNNRLVIQDGATAGGFAAAKLSEVITNARTAVSDASYAASSSDRMIAYTALTSARTVTLPAASSFPTGTRLLVLDESGACSAANTITLSRAGSDSINGAASMPLAVPYAYGALESNGSNAWTIIDQISPAPLSAIAQGTTGATSQLGVLEFLQSGLSGAAVTCGTQIPSNCILFSVGCRVVSAITGATSYSVGDSGSGDAGAGPSRFGSGLNIAAGSTNFGLVGPAAIYSPAPSIILTAAGGAFTGGSVRLSIHYMLCSPSTS